MAPLFCPRSWFSHQLDGNAGHIDDNSVGVNDDIDLDSVDQEDKQNPYNNHNL